MRGLLQQAEDATQPFAKRRSAYEGAARACPRDPTIDVAFCALLLKYQEGQSALEWARRSLEVVPNDPNLIAYEGIALLLVGHPEEAVDVLKKVAAEGKNEFYLGMAYRALREPKQAQRALSHAFATGFEDPYLLYVLIEQDRAAGDKEAGLRDFRTFHDRFPDSPWLHMLYGDAYMARNDDAGAEAEYEQVLKLAPHLAAVHYQLGFIDFNRANYAAAEEHLRKEIAVDPTFADSYLYLGESLRRLGRNSEALPFLKQAVVRDPNNILAYNALATAQNQAKQPEEALRTLLGGEKRFPEEAAFPAQLAGLLRRLGRPEEAKKEAEKATLLSRQKNPVKHGLPAEQTAPGPPPDGHD